MIEGKTSNYTGTSTDINRERRLSEYQRAMMLRPAQREMVQARMIANPYERDSSTRLERINSRVNADPYVNSRTSQAFRDALAMREYEQPQSYSASGESDNGYARAQRRAAQSGGQFDPMNDVSVGEVNGRRVVAPQAGKYNGYNAFLAAMGLGDSPSPEAYSYAVDQQRIDPNKRYSDDAKVRAAEAKRKSDQDKLKVKQDEAKAKEDVAYRTKFSGDMARAEGALSKIKSYDGYREMMQKYAAALKGKPQNMLPQDFAQMLDAQGVQYSIPQEGAMPVIVPRNQFDAAKYAPGRDQMEADQVNALTRTPGGSRAVSDYMNQKYAPQIEQWRQQAEARNALPAPQPMQPVQSPQRQSSAPAQVASLESDAQGLQQALVTLQQRGLSQQQAMQRIQQSIQNMPPDKRQRAMAVLQHYGDRILQTQQVR